MRRRNEDQVGLGPRSHLQNKGSYFHKGLAFAGILASLVLLWGCSGVVSGTSSAPPPQTYTISGAISPVTGGSGATVTLSGAASAMTTSDATGNYTFTGLANGTYAVTPSHTGYTFTPTGQNATISGANITGLNFTAVAQVAHSATLSWTASTSTVVGYNVYRGTVSGGPYTRVNGSLVTVVTFTDTTVQAGQIFYYVTTAVDSSGTESVNSNEVSANIP
jgi:Carboxypeptidase regulatory-like domain